MRLHEIAGAILEGGNAFKDAGGNILTRRIDREDVEPTIRWLEGIAQLPLINNTIGSVGKKATSGDLDIAVDEKTISKEELIKRLDAWVNQQNGNPKDWIKKSGISVHFKTPINGNAANGYVQTDFMFGDNIDHMKFGLFSAGDQSRYTGADRNLMMSSLAKSLQNDLKYSWQKGLIRRSTGETISKDPDYIAGVLLGSAYKASDLASIESIANAVKDDKSKTKALKDLIVKLRSSENKKPGEIKADAEEADRITAFLSLIT